MEGREVKPVVMDCAVKVVLHPSRISYNRTDASFAILVGSKRSYRFCVVAADMNDNEMPDVWIDGLHRTQRTPDPHEEIQESFWMSSCCPSAEYLAYPRSIPVEQNPMFQSMKLQHSLPV